MRKIIYIIIAVVMIFALTVCYSGSKYENNYNNDEAKIASTTQVSETYDVEVEKTEGVVEDNSSSEIKLEASHESGFYEEEFYLTLSTDTDADIYYTLDSSLPTVNSSKYTSPIHIYDNSQDPNVYSVKENISSIDVFSPEQPVDKCIVLKAIAMNSQGEVSDVICKSFFVNYDEKKGYDNLPVISLVLEPNDLYDYETGIYVTGKVFDENEHTGYPEVWPANYNQKGKAWERSAEFTYFGDDKALSFEQSIGVRIHGGWSRAFNQKSFNLYARKDYSGTKSFEKPFFDTEKMQSCMLRSGGYRDTFLTKTRDSLTQDLSKDEGFSVQDSYPCILFLNGEYWGVYNLQERFTEYYVEEHFNVDKDNVMIIENDVVDEGEDSDIEYYQDLVEFFKNNNFSDETAYKEVHKYIDVNEFASYMATELYAGNIDWPGNNVRMWRARETSNKPYEDGKWHFMMYDTDDSSGILSHMCKYDKDPFVNATHWKNGPLDDNCTIGLMFTKLLENREFKNLFIETFIRTGEELYNPEKVNQYIDERETLLSEPMELFYRRFVSENTQTYNSEYYKKSNDVIREFFNKRYEYAYEFLKEHVQENEINVFGVCWEGGSETALRRLSPASDPNNYVNTSINTEPVAAVGNETGYSPFDEYWPWAGMQEYNIVDNEVLYSSSDEAFSRDKYDTLVYIPEFYCKVVSDGEKTYFYIADGPIEDFILHPGSDSYVGRYNTINGHYSKSQELPLTGLTRAEARVGAISKGSKWSQYDYKH